LVQFTEYKKLSVWNHWWKSHVHNNLNASILIDATRMEMMNNIKNQDFVVIGNINVDFVQLLFVYEILINMICATYYHNFNS
jgi:hypothetical protein